MRKRLTGFVALMFMGGVSSLAGQVRTFSPASERGVYARMLEARGALPTFPLIFRGLNTEAFASDAADSLAPWILGRDNRIRRIGKSNVTVATIPLELETQINSKYPRSANDGALWAGKGLSVQVRGGVRIGWGPLTGTFLPTIYYARNASFETADVPFPDRSAFAYPWSANIDLPQRFGADPFTKYDWGQSGVRLNLGRFTAAFSNENMWWGPALRNPIVMGSTAPGFAHVDLGTGTPVATVIGQLEARVIWGQLGESDYFDQQPDNNRRYITGITLGYRPSFLPELVLGATRVFYQTWPTDGIGASELFDVFGEFFNTGGRDTLPDGRVVNDRTDQIASFVARWVLPESGFEAFVEWARNDFSGSIRDLTLQPDHSRGYTLGFQKTIGSGSAVSRVSGEFTTLGRSSTFLHRASPPFYIHGIVTQGYTHRGQLLGAAIGPGGQSQFLGFDRYTADGRWGVFIERIRFNDDHSFQTFSSVGFENVEITVGASVFRFLTGFEVGGRIELSRRLNWNFNAGNDLTNVTLGLRVAHAGF